MRAIKLLGSCLFLIILATIFTRSSFAKADGQILFQPSFQQLPMNSKFSVDVLIKTSEPLVGADVKINFDPRVLEVEKIVGGEAFKKVPLKSLKGGTITITALAPRGDTFAGSGRLATIYFKAKDAGDTKLKVAFKESSTTDSNLVTPKVADVLTKAETGQFLIGTATQRSVGAVKRFLLKVIPVLIFLIIVGILAYLAYRWWKQQKEGERPVFIPQHVPLDQPPVQ